MKVKTSTRIIDTNREPIMLLFADDEALKEFHNRIGDMLNNPTGTIRKFYTGPEEIPEAEAREFMKLSYEERMEIKYPD